MPTYVYACDSCGNQFEQVQRFQDEPLKICPCGKEGQVRRVFQPVGIVFKGSGWYVTDSRKSSAPAAESKAGEKAESGEKAASSEKAEGGGKAASSEKAGTEKAESSGEKASKEPVKEAAKPAAGSTP